MVGTENCMLVEKLIKNLMEFKRQFYLLYINITSRFPSNVYKELTSKVKFKSAEIVDNKIIVYSKNIRLYKNEIQNLSPKIIALIKSKIGIEIDTSPIFQKKVDQIYLNSTIELFKTTHYSLNYVVTSNPTEIFLATLVVNIQLKDLHFLYGTICPTKIMPSILTYFFENNFFPVVFDKNYKTPPPPIKNIVKLSNGSLLWLPHPNDNRENFIKSISKVGTLPKNKTILVDYRKNTIYQTNYESKLCTFDIFGSMTLTDEDIVSLFNRTLFSIFFDSNNPSSIEYIWPNVKLKKPVIELKRKLTSKYMNKIGGYELSKKIESDDEYKKEKRRDDEYTKVISKYLDKKILIKDVPKQDLVFILLFYKELFEYNKDLRRPSDYLQVMGTLQILLLNIDKYAETKRKLDSKKELFNSATKHDVGEIPNIDNVSMFFPQQAEALAKLECAGALCVIDIGVGGGKTLILAAEILQKLYTGQIKRGLIVCPVSITAQWINQLKHFTNNSVNIIPITTETINNWGIEEINLLIRQAPLNSIFITSYPFLRKENKTNLGCYYPNAEFIKNALNPDYVGLDESQFIKNTESATHKACMVFRDTKYRRVSTGTLIINSPTDLVGQMMFLNPRLLGSKPEFASRYAIDGAYNEKTGSVALNGWQNSALKDIREDLQKSAYYLKYDERDWAATLPKIEHNYYVVEMTNNQTKLYRKILSGIIEEIKKDPQLLNAWLAFQRSEDEDINVAIYTSILAKFAKLEQFITAPSYYKLSNYIANETLNEADKISPKLSKVDELIDKSIKNKGKVLVTAHHKICVRHLYEHSKHKKIGMYFDASNKAGLQQFLDPKSNIKVLFAVYNSLSEGYNLQIAERIIRVDYDWTTGKEKQLKSRMWRPLSPTKVNKNKTVYMDSIIANRSVDVPKIAFLISKKLINTLAVEDCPLDPSVPPELNEDMLSADVSEIENYLLKNIKFDAWFENEIEDKRNDPSYLPIAPNHAENRIPGKIMHTPWVDGMIVPDNIEGSPVTEYLEDAENLQVDKAGKIEDLSLYKKRLMGKRVFVENQEGAITGVSKNKIRVRLDNNALRSFPASLVTIVFDKIVDQKKKVKVKSSKMDIYVKPKMFNGQYSLNIRTKSDSIRLLKYGCMYKGEYLYYPIKNKTVGRHLLNRLENQYKIPKLCKDECYQVLKEMRREKIETIPDIRHFFKIKHTSAETDGLKIYPLVFNSKVFFVVDVSSHKTLVSELLKDFKFRKNPNKYYVWYYIPELQDKNLLSKTVDVINKDGQIKIKNVSESRKTIKAL